MTRLQLSWQRFIGLNKEALKLYIVGVQCDANIVALVDRILLLLAVLAKVAHREAQRKW